SRRRHTRSKRDWSSDVCSSDLQLPTVALHGPRTVSENVRHVTGTVNEQPVDPIGWQAVTMMWALKVIRSTTAAARRGRRRWPWRSEERRVGKEWSAGWGPSQ